MTTQRAVPFVNSTASLAFQVCRLPDIGWQSWKKQLVVIHATLILAFQDRTFFFSFSFRLQISRDSILFSILKRIANEKERVSYQSFFLYWVRRLEDFFYAWNVSRVTGKLIFIFFLQSDFFFQSITRESLNRKINGQSIIRSLQQHAWLIFFVFLTNNRLLDIRNSRWILYAMVQVENKIIIYNCYDFYSTTVWNYLIYNKNEK